MLFRCQLTDGVTWSSEDNSRLQFHLSLELIGEAAFVNIVCDVSLCRHDNGTSAASIHSGGDAIPQV